MPSCTYFNGLIATFDSFDRGVFSLSIIVSGAFIASTPCRRDNAIISVSKEFSFSTQVLLTIVRLRMCQTPMLSEPPFFSFVRVCY